MAYRYSLVSSLRCVEANRNSAMLSIYYLALGLHERRKFSLFETFVLFVGMPQLRSIAQKKTEVFI